MVSFGEWLIGILVNEAVQFYGGKNRGWKEYPSLNHIDGWWFEWLNKKLDENPNTWLPRIVVDGQEWNRDQIINHIRNTGSQPVKPPISQPSQPVQPQTRSSRTKISQNQGPWVLATANVDEELPDHNDVPHKIKKGQYVALKDNGDDTWAYATIWKGNLQWHNAHMPKEELAGRFKSVTDSSGSPVRGLKASQLAKSTFKEENKKFEPTEEQQAISQRFEDMKKGKDSDHIVINALAGTGKTTVLKHLAEKYGKRGEKWLYLVFGRKNREEAVEKFPSFVDVYTTNSYAGQVLDNNKVKPTERIAEYSRSNKITEIIDGPQYQKFLSELNIPHFDSPSVSKYVKGYMRSIWREFNKEVEKLTGLAKAYNLSPDNAKEGIQQIATEHDINNELEKTKERLEKDPNFSFFNDEISSFMGVNNFFKEDFLDRMIKASTWLLEKSMPHGIDQEFTQTHERKRGRWQRLQTPLKRNLRGLRDFDDDLWYAAQHADELDWSKPKKYKFVLVDEVQDFNKAQKVILGKLVENGARVVAVGDPNQSLYRFRGADDAAFQDITNMLVGASKNPEGTLKTLTKNFRSKPGIIDYSNENTIVNNLQAGKEFDPHDPAHLSIGELKHDETIKRLGKEMESLGEMKKQTAFIARTNEPLAKAAMDLLKNKIPFIIYGKDLANDVVNLVNRVLNWQKYKVVNDDSDLIDFKSELDSFVEEKKEKWSGSSRKAGQLKDLMEAQEALHSSIDVISQEQEMDNDPSVAEFKDWLYMRLGGVPDHMTKSQKEALKKKLEEDNPVVLTTAHRSKGLEFDRVFELTPSLYPHPRTKLDADFAQEENARYVAGTRAKDEYHVVNDSKD